MQRYNRPTPNTKKSVQLVHYFCFTAHPRPTVGANHPTSPTPLSCLMSLLCPPPYHAHYAPPTYHPINYRPAPKLKYPKTPQKPRPKPPTSKKIPIFAHNNP